MTEKAEPSFTVTVYVAGDYHAARASLRRLTMAREMCVTVTPTTFIYTAGAEDGVAVGLVNYPRFAPGEAEVWDRAKAVARVLMDELCQRTALIVGPSETVWLAR